VVKRTGVKGFPPARTSLRKRSWAKRNAPLRPSAATTGRRVGLWGRARSVAGGRVLLVETVARVARGGPNGGPSPTEIRTLGLQRREPRGRSAANSASRIARVEARFQGPGVRRGADAEAGAPSLGHTVAVLPARAIASCRSWATTIRVNAIARHVFRETRRPGRVSTPCKEAEGARVRREAVAP